MTSNNFGKITADKKGKFNCKSEGEKIRFESSKTRKLIFITQFSINKGARE